MGITTYSDGTMLTSEQEWEMSVKERESQTMTAENFDDLTHDGRSVVLFSRGRCQVCTEYAGMIKALIDENRDDLIDVTFHEVDIADPLNLWTRESASMKRRAWLNWKVPHVAVFHNRETIHVSPTEAVESTKKELLGLLIRR